MKIYEFDSYEDYVEAQTLANIRKIDFIWAKDEIILEIAKDKGTAKNILCHGTRNGAEQKYFKTYFCDAYVVGTEISKTATQFPMTVQHDFTFPKDEWIGKFDIVYSNSFDHSIDPEKTIQTWRDQLSDTGKLYIEYCEIASWACQSDPLEADDEEVKEMIEKYLKVEKIIHHGGDSTIFVCVKND